MSCECQFSSDVTKTACFCQQVLAKANTTGMERMVIDNGDRMWYAIPPCLLNVLPGTKAEEEKWIVGEFNCSCVGISRCLAAYCKDDTPNACYDDISAEDKAEAKKMGDLMGEKALAILKKWVPELFSLWAVAFHLHFPKAKIHNSESKKTETWPSATCKNDI